MIPYSGMYGLAGSNNAHNRQPDFDDDDDDDYDDESDDDLQTPLPLPASGTGTGNNSVNPSQQNSNSASPSNLALPGPGRTNFRPSASPLVQSPTATGEVRSGSLDEDDEGRYSPRVGHGQSAVGAGVGSRSRNGSLAPQVLPWMVGLPTSSAAASPYNREATPGQSVDEDVKPSINLNSDDDRDGGMDVDEPAAINGNGNGHGVRAENEVEKKMKQRFPTWTREGDLRLTELGYVEPMGIREPKRRRIEDHRISSIEPEHSQPSQYESYTRPLRHIDKLNRARVPHWADAGRHLIERRGRVRSNDGVGGEGAGERLEGVGRFEVLVSQFAGKKEVEKHKEDDQVRKPAKEPSMAELVNWEENIVWGIDVERKKPQEEILRVEKRPEGLRKFNAELQKGDWLSRLTAGLALPGEEDEMMDDASDFLSSFNDNISLDLDRTTRALNILRKAKVGPDGLPMDFFNISNDEHYQPVKPRKVTFRQQGVIDIVHAGPAVKTQYPFYKPTLTDAEKRSLHRYSLQFPTGVPIRFDKLLPSTNRTKAQRENVMKAEKQGKKVEPEIPKTSKDLSMANRVPYVLLEYSEETPWALSGYGMGSCLYNYYRHHGEDDQDVPEHKIGQPVMLQRNDPQPFPLSFVDAGQEMRSIQTTFSNAPVYEHRAPGGDFLVIRRTVDDQSRYYIREINHLFVVGQTVPLPNQPKENSMEAPNAIGLQRRHTRWFKEIIRRISKKNNGKFKSSQLKGYVPDWSEQQLTGFLKGFAQSEVIRHDKEWTLIRDPADGKLKIDSPDHLQTPPAEELVLSASVLHADQWLRDHAHPTTSVAKEEKILVPIMDRSRDEKDFEEQAKYIENRLAPWYQAANYSAAASSSLAAGAAANSVQHMLNLTGEGDPTGRGEGFSLLELSAAQRKERYKAAIADARKFDGANPKNRTLREATSAVYEDRQRRIWDKGRRALMTAERARPDGPNSNVGKARAVFAAQEEARQETYRREIEKGQKDTQLGQDKKLRISRTAKDGTVEYEEIDDPVIITAYLEAKMKEAISQTNFVATDTYQKLSSYKQQRMKNVDAFLAKNLGHAIAKVKEKKTKPAVDPATAPQRTKRCRKCNSLDHTAASPICPVNLADPDFVSRKGVAKGGPGRKKKKMDGQEFKFDEDGGGGGGGGGLSTPMTPMPMGMGGFGYGGGGGGGGGLKLKMGGGGAGGAGRS